MTEKIVKTDEKKQHFDDIYLAENPVAYKEKILDALEYISDNYNRQIFDRLILPEVEKIASPTHPLQFVDLAGCFGNTTLATLYGMTYEDIQTNWQDESSCYSIKTPRRLTAQTTGIDQSKNALAYGKKAGIYDNTIQVDINHPSADAKKDVEDALTKAHVVISTAALVYFEPEAIQHLLDVFVQGKQQGYMLVNFLNPFALEKSDETKRILLSKLQFVGSTASRHRKLSAMERENYPGEEWSHLEIWVLKRR